MPIRIRVRSKRRKKEVGDFMKLVDRQVWLWLSSDKELSSKPKASPASAEQIKALGKLAGQAQVLRAVRSRSHALRTRHGVKASSLVAIAELAACLPKAPKRPPKDL